MYWNEYDYCIIDNAPGLIVTWMYWNNTTFAQTSGCNSINSNMDVLKHIRFRTRPYIILINSNMDVLKHIFFLQGVYYAID